jgi:NAD(P)-dependent dehydrogenase (short-subunit alcohol dehydrogenase family)
MRELIEARPARATSTARQLPLDGLVAMVTGGGQGLGEQVCEVLTEAGASVAVADVDAARAMGVANRLHANGAAAEFLALDVSDAAACEAALRQLVDSHGHLDVIVNNAGVDVTLPIDELSIEQFDRVLAVNLRGPFVLSKLALPMMAAQGRGHIVNVVSTAAKRTWANASAYHASKWGLLGLSHALHVEAREVGVKVTAVVAGGMRTPFILGRFPDVDPSTLQDPRNVAETIRFVLSQPDETVIPEVMVLPMRETSWP